MPGYLYCTEADVREQLGDTSSRLDAGLLERAIAAASRAVDNWCGPGRRFWRDTTTTTRLFRVDSPRLAWVDDISTTDGLLIATDPGLNGTFATAWTAADYQLGPLNGGVAAAGDPVVPSAFWTIAAVNPAGRPYFPFAQDRAVLRVTARFGWSAVPDEVVQATILKAAALFRRKDAPFGVAGFGELGVVRISRADPDVVELLTPYLKRRPRTLTYAPQRGSLFHRGGW